MAIGLLRPSILVRRNEVFGWRDFTCCGFIAANHEYILACKLSCRLFVETKLLLGRLLQGTTEFIYAAAASKATENMLLAWWYGKLYAGKVDFIMDLTWMLWETVRRRGGCYHGSDMDAHPNSPCVVAPVTLMTRKLPKCCSCHAGRSRWACARTHVVRVCVCTEPRTKRYPKFWEPPC